jgi:hypothetical protein
MSVICTNWPEYRAAFENALVETLGMAGHSWPLATNARTPRFEADLRRAFVHAEDTARSLATLHAIAVNGAMRPCATDETARLTARA